MASRCASLHLHNAPPHLAVLDPTPRPANSAETRGSQNETAWQGEKRRGQKNRASYAAIERPYHSTPHPQVAPPPPPSKCPTSPVGRRTQVICCCHTTAGPHRSASHAAKPHRACLPYLIRRSTICTFCGHVEAARPPLPSLLPLVAASLGRSGILNQEEGGGDQVRVIVEGFSVRKLVAPPVNGMGHVCLCPWGPITFPYGEGMLVNPGGEIRSRMCLHLRGARAVPGISHNSQCATPDDAPGDSALAGTRGTDKTGLWLEWCAARALRLGNGHMLPPKSCQKIDYKC